MSKAYENKVKQWDSLIKSLVYDIAARLEIKVQFKGYYFEENPVSFSGAAVPAYNNFKDYHDHLPSHMFIEHARYFFELRSGAIKKTLTVHLYEKNFTTIQYCIDDQSEYGRVRSNPESVTGHEELEVLMKNKLH